jgi:hypothetical protein
MMLVFVLYMCFTTIRRLKLVLCSQPFCARSAAESQRLACQIVLLIGDNFGSKAACASSCVLTARRGNIPSSASTYWSIDATEAEVAPETKERDVE